MKSIMKSKVFMLALILVFIVSAFTIFVGCQKKAAKQAKSIAVVTPYMANATTALVIEKFKGYAEGNGWTVSVSDTAGDFGLLVSRIEDAVNQKVDAIVLGMGDPVQMTKGLEAAASANIPVFGLDAGVTEGVVLNVTSDNTDLGIASAKALAAAIGEKGNVVLFTHDPHPGVRERAEGAIKAFENYPEITILEKKHIDVPGPIENGRKIMEDLLVAYPEAGSISGVWAGWDEPAFGANQAIEMSQTRDKDVKVVGIDGTDFAKAEILKKGAFIATVEQDFDGMAKKLAALMNDYFKGKKSAEKWYKIQGKLITPENAGENVVEE